MALLLGTVVYVLVLIFGTIAAATLGDIPPPIRLAIVIATEITLMTYVLLPYLTRRLARWIYPTTRQH
jgi:antibiotic biosynthesis monooxygenase (ABM) superfamily enzyme